MIPLATTAPNKDLPAVLAHHTETKKFTALNRRLRLAQLAKTCSLSFAHFLLS